MTDMEINNTIMVQLYADYNCTSEMLKEKKIHFTELVGTTARRVDLRDKKFLCLVINGTAIMCATNDLLRPLRERFIDRDPQWLFEAPRILDVYHALSSFPIDWRNLKLHIVFSCKAALPVLTLEQGLTLKWYEAGQMETFRDTVFAEEALLFDDDRPDYLAVGALDGEQVIGLAGASIEAPSVCQLGINVIEGYERRHIASTLINALTRELINRGKVPFYDTAFSHIASQKVALNAGFSPLWTSLHAQYLAEQTCP